MNGEDMKKAMKVKRISWIEVGIALILMGLIAVVFGIGVKLRHFIL